MRDRRPEIRRVLWITLGLNIAVLVLKVGVGLWTNSLSVLADALHSVTDSASNILGLVAVKMASPHPDREHPYGHLKFEAVAALGIAGFLGMACLEILKGIADRLLSGGEPLHVSATALWLMLIVLGANIFTAFYERRVGLRLGSSILVADSYHTMGDVWITIAVISGLLGAWAGMASGITWLRWLDVVLALPVAILVVRSGWKVLRENLPVLVDEMAIAPEEIRAVVHEVPGVVNCHDIASRGVVGRQVFVEMHLIVSASDVRSAHAIADEVEARLHDRFAPVRVTIHIEPPEYTSERLTYSEDDDRF